MLIRLSLLIFFIAIFPSQSEAVGCQTRPIAGSYSSWRYVDGRKCWFKGRRWVSRAALHWPGAGRRAVPNAVRPNSGFKSRDRGTPSERDEHDVLNTSVWPALGPDTFEERFNGEDHAQPK